MLESRIQGGGGKIRIGPGGGGGGGGGLSETIRGTCGWD